ncbi:MAG: hypothetical protein LBR23_03040 [Spirochaetaceae bacterium]|jgi:hypothetical protein|nr:hypothetical protein [Spirochaetaceae bacterium]
MKRRVIILTTTILAAVVLLCGCPQTPSGEGSNPYGSETTQTKNVTLAANETLYLVRVNPSSTTVPHAYTGTTASGSQAAYMQGSRSVFQQNLGAEEDAPVIRPHRASQEFNANPPRFAEIQDGRSRSVLGENHGYAACAVGDTGQFWVENSAKVMVQKNATLKVRSTWAKIWVADDNFDDASNVNDDNKITALQADDLAEKFDLIYPIETAFFGTEMRKASANTPNPADVKGIDGDDRIQILVYDIDDDYPSNQSGGTFGYFWGKDEYTQAQLDSGGASAYKSNEAEIFYLDAHFLDKYPETMYSTLVHEFQHMIHFNRKTLRLGRNSETWYNEMLSMLAEDMISPLIEVGADNSGHPINMRIPTFNVYYICGLTSWLSGNAAVYSYSVAYAFGAYLARNYGGAAFVKDMFDNDEVNQASITAALAGQSVDPRVDSFEDALLRFPEALLNNTTSGITFNKTVNYSMNVPTVGSTNYNFAAFNIYDNNYKVSDGVFNALDISKGSYTNGPLFGLYLTSGMPPASMNIQAFLPGQSSVTYTQWTNSPVKFRWYVKKADGTVTQK